MCFTRTAVALLLSLYTVVFIKMSLGFKERVSQQLFPVLKFVFMFHRVLGRQLRSHLLLLHQGRWTPRAWGGASCRGAACGARGSWSHKVLSESFRGSRATGRSRGQMVTALQRARSRWESGQGHPGALAGWQAGSVTVAGDCAIPARVPMDDAGRGRLCWSAGFLAPLGRQPPNTGAVLR